MIRTFNVGKEECKGGREHFIPLGKASFRPPKWASIQDRLIPLLAAA
jgi:hypothetical protein